MAGAKDGEEKSKRPANTAFKQQNLKAWRPILTPKTVISTFFIVGIIFVPIGVIVLVTSQNIAEVQSTNYVSDQSEGGCCIKNCDSHTTDERVDLNPCIININITQDMEPPIYMYYKLTQFYQNHRMYVKSRDDAQLSGATGLTPSLTEPYCRVGSDSKVGWAGPESDDSDGVNDTVANAVSPCGLIANSYFNDSFRIIEANATNTIRAVSQTSTDISWKSDRETKFKNAPDGSTGSNFRGFATEKASSCDTLPDGSLPTAEVKTACQEAKTTALGYSDGQDPGWCYPGSGRCNEDEHFIVWMRTAGLPSFRKLYAKIEEKLYKGRQYRVQIWNGQAMAPSPLDAVSSTSSNGTLYPVHTFHGEKFVVLSTTAWIGGKNDFLGIAYIVVGAICLVLALAFFVKDRISPRDFSGNPAANK